MGKFPCECSHHTCACMDALLTTSLCDRSALAARVEPPLADRALRLWFQFMPHSARRCVWRGTGQTHAAYGPRPRALPDPGGSHVLAGGLFTRYCNRFAPATRITQIGHFNPTCRSPAQTPADLGSAPNDRLGARLGWFPCEPRSRLHQCGAGRAPTPRFKDLNFHAGRGRPQSGWHGAGYRQW